jgi:hypothetical protein
MKSNTPDGKKKVIKHQNPAKKSITPDDQK